MPSWVGLLAEMHRFAPILYLTPEFTRNVRFPRSYVTNNPNWNDQMKRTVWETVFTMMARRPEIPPAAGNWGLLLRLNVANATFCKDWYMDVTKSCLEDAECPERLQQIVEMYVDRCSSSDRPIGGVIAELSRTGIDVSPEAFGCKAEDFANGQPKSPEAVQAVRAKYREALFENTKMCVLTTDTLLFQSEKNKVLGLNAHGCEEAIPRCGYRDALHSLADVFGAEEAVRLLQDLPLRRLTPAYDVVSMICAESIMDSEAEDVIVGADLQLHYGEADATMGLALISEEQMKLSSFPILQTLPQTGAGIYGAGPFS
jgi:hypothetical protein